MALELTSSVSIEFDNDLQSLSLSVSNRKLTSADPNAVQLLQEIGTSEEVINLGGLASLGSFMVKNLDPTNYVTVKSGLSGTVLAVLKPDLNGDGTGGWFACDYAGSGMQAPAAVANTAECRIAVFAAAQ